jgi:hypothetical protein
MINEVTKPKPQALDNFGDFDDSVEGDQGRVAGRLLVGTRLKFTNEATWETVNGDDYTDRVLLATNIRRLEIKWGETGPIDHRELQPGQKFRDLEALNALCPRSEWREDFNGKPKGPWEYQYVLELVDLETMERFSWPTATIGGGICIRELVDRINMKRRLEKRADMWPRVRLSHCFMKTKYKGRERPDCKIVDWYPPEDADKHDRIEAAPTQPKLPPAREQAPEPSLKEEMNDEVKF